MLTNIMNGIKEFLGLPVYVIEEKRFMGIDYTIHEKAMKRQGCKLAALFPNRIFVKNKKIRFEDKIYVDRNFEELDHNTKLFILLHETGHKIFNHAYEAYLDGERGYQKREKEADKYAMIYMTIDDIISSMWNVYKWIQKNEPTNVFGQMLFKERIEYMVKEANKMEEKCNG